MSTNTSEQHRAYWQGIIQGADDGAVDETGHPDMGRAWNQWAYRLRLRAWRAAIRELPSSLLDTGVFEAAYGVGFYLREWKAMGVRRLAGMDISAVSHANCKARYPEYDLRQGDLSTLANAPDWNTLRASFGVVTAIDVLYHITDDAAATASLRALGSLVRPGGVLMVSEKHNGLSAPFAEAPHVMRRPLSWYENVLGPLGLRATSFRPIFFGMDFPSYWGTLLPAYIAGRIEWVSMRALLKFLPRNSAPQQLLGSVLGAGGYAVDRLALSLLSNTANLRLILFRAGEHA